MALAWGVAAGSLYWASDFPRANEAIIERNSWVSAVADRQTTHASRETPSTELTAGRGTGFSPGPISRGALQLDDRQVSPRVHEPDDHVNSFYSFALPVRLLRPARTRLERRGAARFALVHFERRQPIERLMRPVDVVPGRVRSSFTAHPRETEWHLDEPSAPGLHGSKEPLDDCDAAFDRPPRTLPPSIMASGPPDEGRGAWPRRLFEEVRSPLGPVDDTPESGVVGIGCTPGASLRSRPAPPEACRRSRGSRARLGAFR